MRAHSQPKINPDSLLFLTKVDDSNDIYLPFMNNTKGVKEVKQGTLLGTFESLNFETVNVIQTPSGILPKITSLTLLLHLCLLSLTRTAVLPSLLSLKLNSFLKPSVITPP